MSTAAAARLARPRHASRDVAPTPTPDLHPHWSEVSPSRSRCAPTDDEPLGTRPTPATARMLADLVSWAADLGIVLTHQCPEDRAAIEGVRRYVHAWLAGVARPDVRIEDVLTTVAVLMSAIDLDLARARRPVRKPRTAQAHAA